MGCRSTVTRVRHWLLAAALAACGISQVAVAAADGASGTARAHSCRRVVFPSRPTLLHAAVHITAQRVDCATARRVAAASKPFTPRRGRHVSYHADGFACHGVDRMPPHGGLEALDFTCRRGQATITFQRIQT